MSTLIELQELERYFKTPKGQLHAVDKISMKFEQGTTMGVVGESGCGKSTLARTIIHLQEPTGGKMFFEGEDMTHPNKAMIKRLRNHMQIIFQDPYMTLNPRYTVEDTLKEPLVLSGKYTKGESLNKEIRRLMDMIGISGRLRMSYPHELSGGRRQRVGIGRALAMDPKFIACDEPVASLDVSIQAQIINLLQDLQKDFGLTYMFVTHDMSVVRFISHDISVMYLGQLVETSPSQELFERPLHPYSKALLSAIPTTDIDKPRERIRLKGELMSPINPKPGCRFLPRCEYATEACQQPQKLEELLPGHFVACCRARQLNNLS
ncbi:MAG: ATP-binding cassette domain-containing protein [Lachnospiraceae bacterium]|nr:ATP-binding cassette domain-containing protein [Lachnospiraceae bacterium]